MEIFYFFDSSNPNRTLLPLIHNSKLTKASNTTEITVFFNKAKIPIQTEIKTFANSSFNQSYSFYSEPVTVPSG